MINGNINIVFFRVVSFNHSIPNQLIRASRPLFLVDWHFNTMVMESLFSMFWVFFIRICSADLELNALREQHGSRLPFGELEQFVYSMDRRSLLSKWNDSTMNKEDYHYFSMLQIENELSWTNISDLNQITKLQNDFEEIVKMVNEQYTNSDRIPSNIKDLIFRNQFRQIFDYKKYDKDIIDDFLDSIKQKIPHNFNHKKPRDNKGIHDNIDSKKDNASFIDEGIIFNELNNSLHDSFKEGHYGSISIKWILENKYDELLNDVNKIIHLLQFYQQSKISMYPELVQKLLVKLFVNKSKHTLDLKQILKHLPMKQINGLMEYSFNTTYHRQVLNQYINKLIPVQLSLYHQQSWIDHDIIPIELKWEYIQRLYQNTRHFKDDDMIGIHRDILFQYIMFIEQNYFILGLKHPFELQPVMEYLNVSKLTYLPRYDYDAALNKKFINVPPHNIRTTWKMIQRFIEFLNTENGTIYYTEFNNISSNSYNEINITQQFMNYDICRTSYHNIMV